MATPAQRILMALAASRGDQGRRVSSGAIEPLAIVREHSSDFGTYFGQQTIAELQDLLTLWSYRMQQMTAAYANASPSWVAKDSAGFVDFTNDWNALQARYSAARGIAENTVTLSKLNPMPASMIGAQAAFAGLSKAMRQCYPPDGCPTTKGDWTDLFGRLSAVGFTPTDRPPQPVASDADLQAFKAMAPLDVVAPLVGATKPPTAPAGPLAKLKTFLTGAALGGGAIVGFSLAGPIGAAVGGVLGFGVVEVLSLSAKK